MTRGTQWSDAAMQDLFEFLIRTVVELVIEVLLKGPGYLILRVFRPDLVAGTGSAFDGPDGCLVASIGIVFWSVILGAIWFCTR